MQYACLSIWLCLCYVRCESCRICILRRNGVTLIMYTHSAWLQIRGLENDVRKKSRDWCPNAVLTLSAHNIIIIKILVNSLLRDFFKLITDQRSANRLLKSTLEFDATLLETAGKKSHAFTESLHETFSCFAYTVQRACLRETLVRNLRSAISWGILPPMD